MGYTGNYYWTRSSLDLRTLKSKKYNRLTKLRGRPQTYLEKQEISTLVEQLGWLEAVLRARAEQTKFDNI